MKEETTPFPERTRDPVRRNYRPGLILVYTPEDMRMRSPVPVVRNFLASRSDEAYL